MNSYAAQQVLLRTGSFTGYRPYEALGSNYMQAAGFEAPMCGNEEGWGPMSPFRYDFTPCFIDVWIASVAVFGLILGPIAIWLLLKQKETLRHNAKNAHWWIKQVRHQYTSLQSTGIY